MIQKKVLLWGALFILSLIVLLVSARYYSALAVEYVPESAGSGEAGNGWLAGLTAVASLISTIISTIGMTYTITHSRLEIQKLRAELDEKEQKRKQKNGSKSDEI